MAEVGKTREFAQQLLDIYVNKQGVASIAPTDLQIGLLSAVPAGTPPYTQAAIRAAEYSQTPLAGDFRSAVLTESNLSTTGVDSGAGALFRQSNSTIEFALAAPVAFTIFGYCLTKVVTGSNSDSNYLAYEIFDEGPKRKAIGANDNIRINPTNLKILEK